MNFSGAFTARPDFLLPFATGVLDTSFWISMRGARRVVISALVATMTPIFYKGGKVVGCSIHLVDVDLYRERVDELSRSFAHIQLGLVPQNERLDFAA